ncbi:MAG: bifunctional oligoribonuclease/PAP phosphatase NrnA [Oscillospiraceae bacterium]
MKKMTETSKPLSFDEIDSFFKTHDNYNILTHKNPDGDTLGCGFALCRYLRNCGKNANVINSEKFPSRYDILCKEYKPQEFEVQTVVAVDIADVQLMGEGLEEYKQQGRVDLCIDHHISNKHYAKADYVDGKASAASLVIYQFLKHINANIDDYMAKCMYLGIATDTGCFKFENTVPEAHIAAAELMQYDFDFAAVNRKMFDLKSKGRLKAERVVMSGIKYYCNNKCAVICLTKELMSSCGVEESEFDGLASMPLQVEGVHIGITIKEREENVYKISVRTTPEVDACEFCSNFGGGGHIRAAGCEIKGSLEFVTNVLVQQAEKVFNYE